MTDEISAMTKNTGPNVGIDGEATNLRHRANVFAPEPILSEKEIMRKNIKENSEAIKEVSPLTQLCWTTKF